LTQVWGVSRMRRATAATIDSGIGTDVGSGLMDGPLFDRLSARLAVAPESRRSTLRRLAGGGVAALLLRVDAEPISAKKKKRKKCKKGKTKCGRTCIPTAGCCTSGMPGCPAFSACTNGQCVCTQGLRQCGQECIPTAACCTDAECGAVPCIAHTCDCTGRGDGTACGGGKQCSGGVCAKPPPCTAGFDSCVVDADCCSVSCLPVLGTKVCTCSPGGKQCRGGDCCAGLNCVGFFCQ
jgi:hypothetical protein